MLPQHICCGAQMAQDGDAKESMTAAELRKQAARARRLLRGISGEADRLRLGELADQFEAQAAALDEK
jgi:hypothetical protein